MLCMHQHLMSDSNRVFLDHLLWLAFCFFCHLGCGSNKIILKETSLRLLNILLMLLAQFGATGLPRASTGVW